MCAIQVPIIIIVMRMTSGSGDKNGFCMVKKYTGAKSNGIATVECQEINVM